jgi:hypothetical protein
MYEWIFPLRLFLVNEFSIWIYFIFCYCVINMKFSLSYVHYNFNIGMNIYWICSKIITKDESQIPIGKMYFIKQEKC